MSIQVGDKVRIKRDPRKGCRGTVLRVTGNRAVVALAGEPDTLDVASADLTNYSQAARKAWKNMPNRRVGRPRGSRQYDRVSVTLRVDRDLWERFRREEATGLIPDRTATINAWLRRMLDGLDTTMGTKTNGAADH